MLFELDRGHELAYVDPRRFGTGHLLHGREARDAYLGARLGVEPFTPEFTAANLRSQARGRRAPVKSFILDQRRIAGVGNIYADEALFRARIHPLREAGKLTLKQWEVLRVAIEDVLALGIDSQGASIDDFRHIDGARARSGPLPDPHSRRRAVRELRSGDPQAVRRRAGTYVCERCQPRPRANR